jgi:hypothetical protein
MVGKNMMWPVSKYHSGIYPKCLRKTTKYLRIGGLVTFKSSMS